MTGNLTLSANSTGVTSTWTGTGYPPSTVYTTPMTATSIITVTVPSEMANCLFNSAVLSYTVEGASGTRHVYYTGTATEVTNANLLEKLSAGETVSLTFSYRANGGSGGPGTHSAVCRWKNIAITVDYSPAGSVTDTLALTDAGEAVYAIEKKSLAYGESCALTIIARPTVAVTKVKAEMRCNGLSETVSFETERAIPANSGSSFAYTLEISDDMYAEMTNRVYAAQIKISFTSGSTTYATSWTDVGFKFAKTRAAPVISAVTFGEADGTTHISTYGAPIAGKTRPTVSFTVTLDTDADSSIGYETRSIRIDGKTYSLGSNSGTLEILSGSSAYTITVTDSYGQTGTATGTLTVLTYTPPRVSGLAISRYESALSPGGGTIYVLSDDGVNVWLDAVISVQTTLGSGSNPWTLKVTPDGGSAITVANASTNTSKTYEHDRNAISGNYPATSEKSFLVELNDAFTYLSWTIKIPKAGGIFNIERTGVAVGMRSTGTDEEPLFQVAYPAKFLAGIWGEDGNRVDEVHDTDWEALTLSANCAQASGWATCAYRVLNGIVYIRGAVNLAAAMSSSSSNTLLLTTLPSGARPAGQMLVAAGGRGNVASIEIHTDGEVHLMNRTGSSMTTSEVISLTAAFPAD